MLIFKHAKPDLLQESSIALGFFDGIHLGHCSVIKSMLKKSKQLGVSSCVVTFANHPLELLQNKKITSVITLEKRLDIIQKLGVDAVLLLDFTPELISLSAESYLKKILVDSLHPRCITVGFNHFFGANKKGDNQFLQDNASRYGYEVICVPPVEYDSKVVSSSLIKKCLQAGDFEHISKYLGRDYSLDGEVVKGREIGRTIGFATANLMPKFDLEPVPNGVYSGWAVVQGKKYKAMINVGKAPTLKDGEITIEAHLLNFDKDIYGQNIEVGFVHKIRDEKKFASKEDLIAQIKQDLASIR
ncbi:MAG: bifunctional riboflavin kinase/FAD synthetase [Candidatus Gastranaerophilales bacterium]|nr:bifunctional riboflavin kinase/FAD synthetase [Candidatus Gastranaerophilales bacterium]